MLHLKIGRGDSDSMMLSGVTDQVAKRVQSKKILSLTQYLKDLLTMPFTMKQILVVFLMELEILENLIQFLVPSRVVNDSKTV